MALRSKYAKFFGCFAFIASLAVSGLAWANGEEFFQPAGNGKVDLVYFGFIKDTDGKLVDNAFVTIKAKNIGMNFPFELDKIGHYRSPDIGAYYKNMGVPIDPAALEIEVIKPGWKRVTPARPNVPNRTEGVIEIDFVVEKIK